MKSCREFFVQLQVGCFFGLYTQQFSPMLRNALLLTLLLFNAGKSFSQTDAYSGTWKMQYVPEFGHSPINMELQIAASEKYIFYPAHLTLQSDSFVAEYELLLVKKNSRELAISRNKFPLSEKPFSLHDWRFFLNGIFDCSRDLNGVSTLTLSRIQIEEHDGVVADSLHLNDRNKETFKNIRKFLKDAELKLKKTNNIPWEHQPFGQISKAATSPEYFGLANTIHIQNRDGFISLSASTKKENDIVSVGLDGRIIIDQRVLTKKVIKDEMLLDTGLNIITVFADNFGSNLPSRGKATFEFGDKRVVLDFANKADSAATFMAIKIFCDQDKAKQTGFQNNIPNDVEKGLQKNEKLLGSIIATSQNLTLAVWDDAAEDGDSISINIDGRWIIKGCPVKKNPRFIPVTLKPGANTISFIADNLGTIPPNTAVLEIIEGNKRKSFFMETTLGENNLIKIFYDNSGQ